MVSLPGFYLLAALYLDMIATTPPVIEMIVDKLTFTMVILAKNELSGGRFTATLHSYHRNIGSI